MRLDYLAALSGILIALQSRVNGELSHNLYSSIQAALISFATGLLLISCIGFSSKDIKLGLFKVKESLKNNDLPWWCVTGGVLGGTFISLQSLLIPRVGVAVLSVGYIAGQTVMSLVIDRIGFTGGGKLKFTQQRVLAAALTVTGVVIAVWDKLLTSNITIFTSVLTVLSGVIVAIQRALNGRLNEVTNQSFSTSLVNFFMGTLFLLILMFVTILIGNTNWHTMPIAPWWMYTGGIWGVIYIAFAATVVQHKGVLQFILYSVGGQLVGSLLLDKFLPVTDLGISHNLILGIVFSYLGVIVGGIGDFRKNRLK